jgi:hypothetical protein
MSDDTRGAGSSRWPHQVSITNDRDDLTFAKVIAFEGIRWIKTPEGILNAEQERELRKK